MGKISLKFFEEDCSGCHACEVACKQEHGLGVGPRVVRVIEQAPYFKPLFCHHLADNSRRRTLNLDFLGFFLGLLGRKNWNCLQKIFL